MGLFENIEKYKSECSEKAMIEINEHKEEIRNFDFSRISIDACELLASKTVILGKTEEENEMIQKEASRTVERRLLECVNISGHEDFIKRVADNTCSWDCDENEREHIIKGAESYKRDAVKS